MDRINLLLKKIETLNEKPDKSTLDIDLMMDYIRVIYADLLDFKNKLPAPIPEISNKKPEDKIVPSEFELPGEPTLEEMTQALEKDRADEEMMEKETEELYKETSEDNTLEGKTHETEKQHSVQEESTVDNNQLSGQSFSNAFQFSEIPRPIHLSKNDIQEFPFPKKTKEDIRKFVGINEKFVFINELFDNNREAYEEVLDELNEFTTTKEALRWLKNSVMQPYSWTEDDFNVQDFLRILESFYNRVTT